MGQNFGFKNIKNVVMRLEKIKRELVGKEFLTKNTDSAISTSKTSENVFVSVFISSFVSVGVWFTRVWFTRSTRADYKKIKISSKSMSCERALNHDQWKLFVKNYEPIGAGLWCVYKITETNCGSRLFVEFIRTEKKYRVSFDKIRLRLSAIPSKIHHIWASALIYNIYNMIKRG